MMRHPIKDTAIALLILAGALASLSLFLGFLYGVGRVLVLFLKVAHG